MRHADIEPLHIAGQVFAGDRVGDAGLQGARYAALHQNALKIADGLLRLFSVRPVRRVVQQAQVIQNALQAAHARALIARFQVEQLAGCLVVVEQALRIFARPAVRRDLIAVFQQVLLKAQHGLPGLLAIEAVRLA